MKLDKIQTARLVQITQFIVVCVAIFTGFCYAFGVGPGLISLGAILAWDLYYDSFAQPKGR